jgi:hypothetical protein
MGRLRVLTDEERRERQREYQKKYWEKRRQARCEALGGVYVHERSAGHFYHKGPRVGGTKAKQQALRDISLECLEGEDYKRNYIRREAEVLRCVKSYPLQFVQLRV